MQASASALPLLSTEVCGVERKRRGYVVAHVVAVVAAARAVHNIRYSSLSNCKGRSASTSVGSPMGFSRCVNTPSKNPVGHHWVLPMALCSLAHKGAKCPQNWRHSSPEIPHKPGVLPWAGTARSTSTAIPAAAPSAFACAEDS